MTEPVNSSQTPTDAESTARSAPADGAVDRIQALGSSVDALAGRPLNEIAEHLDAVHSELQSALADVDSNARG